ncbi:MAG: hypothetical protein KIT39_02535 [Nitrospirales bacterium]|nr:hypothetical protein [Nitrospirales bacterium]
MKLTYAALSPIGGQLNAPGALWTNLGFLEGGWPGRMQIVRNIQYGDRELLNLHQTTDNKKAAYTAAFRFHIKPCRMSWDDEVVGARLPKNINHHMI